METWTASERAPAVTIAELSFSLILILRAYEVITLLDVGKHDDVY